MERYPILKDRSIYYASKTLNDAQENYTTTEKEMLAVVFAGDKFRSYIIGLKVIVYTDDLDRWRRRRPREVAIVWEFSRKR